MAVEARHINIFSPQFISNRDCVKFEQNMNHGEFNLAADDTFAGNPLAMAAAKANFNKTESGLTYNFNSSTVPPPSTKRQRGNQFGDSDANAVVKRRSVAFGSSPSLIDTEFLTQIQNQQQTEIDRFVAQQTEKLRIEIASRQRTQTRILASTVQNAISKKLKEKDDELVRIRNLNWVLQERVKNLYVENQIWHDIAKTNEANANNLRTNLDHVLAQIETFPTAPAAVEEDVESCCGSSGGGEAVTAVSGGCKRCGEREASVLVLPCRHLCLCTVCGSALLQTCPVCDSAMSASVHVNMSS